MDDFKHLTEAEVYEALRDNDLDNPIAAGKAPLLPGVKIGKEWRFARRNLINWVAQGTNGEPDLAALLKNANIRART